LSWQEATAIALAIARGLEALHAQGIVHRDLKPGNVILHRADATSDVVPKIIDLGISKARAAALDPVLRATLTATGQVLGTPQYMSYEQALGDADVDARSDIWSLGCLLHEMLAGQPPFVAPNVNAILAAIRRGNPPPLREAAPGVPAALEALTVRCLRRDRDTRFPDAASLVQALEQVGEARSRGHAIRVAAVVAVAGLLALLALALRAPPPPARPVDPTALPIPVASEPPSASLPPVEPEPALPSEPSAAPVATARPTPTRTRPPPATRINDAGF
jgi:serine/threonine protein kinase